MLKKVIGGLLIACMMAFGATVAFAANGAQHGWLQVNVTDADGNPAATEYTVLSDASVYGFVKLHGNWSSQLQIASCTTTTVTTVKKTSKGTTTTGPTTSTKCTSFADSGTSDTSNTNPPGTPGNPCPSPGSPHACTVPGATTVVSGPTTTTTTSTSGGTTTTTTTTVTGTSKTQYHNTWSWVCGGWRLESETVAVTPVTLYADAWALVESWMSNNTFPAPLGKFSFSLTNDRIASATLTVTKDGVPMGDPVDLMATLNVEAVQYADYVFPPAHPSTASGPTHGPDMSVNAIMALDSAPRNDLDGAGVAEIINPIAFTMTDPGIYQVEVTMTLKSLLVDGSSETITGKAVVTVTLDGSASLPLCDGETTPTIP